MGKGWSGHRGCEVGGADDVEVAGGRGGGFRVWGCWVGVTSMSGGCRGKVVGSGGPAVEARWCGSPTDRAKLDPRLAKLAAGARRRTGARLGLTAE